MMKSKQHAPSSGEPLCLIEQKLLAFKRLYEEKQPDADEDDEVPDAILKARQVFIEALLSCLREPGKVENTLFKYLHNLDYMGVRIQEQDARQRLEYFDTKDNAAFYFMLGFGVAGLTSIAMMGLIGFVSASPFAAVFILGFVCALCYNLLVTKPKMEAIKQEERALFRLFKSNTVECPIEKETLDAIEHMLSAPFEYT